MKLKNQHPSGLSKVLRRPLDLRTLAISNRVKSAFDRPILNSLSDYVDTIAAKRYRIYLKEERKRRYSQWMHMYVIAAILWQVRLISNSLD